MKSKINPFESRRLRKDYFFSRFVTGFGLLVLATFAALILHILINAAPLLKSPALEESSTDEYSVNPPYIRIDSQSSIARANIDGQWVNIGLENCTLVMTDIAGSQVEDNTTKKRSIKRFAPNCEKRVLGLLRQQSDESYYVAMLDTNRLLELHKLGTNKSLTLHTSFILPEAFLTSASGAWRFNLLNEDLFISRQIDARKPNSNAGLITLRHTLNSLLVPTFQTYEGAIQIFPMLRFNQILAVYSDEIKVYDHNQQILQSIDVGYEVSSASLSPSELDLYVFQKAPATLLRYSVANQQGDFLLSKNFTVEVADDFSNYPSYFSYDLRHDAGIAVNEQGQLLLFNLVTGALEYKYDFAKPIVFADYRASTIVLGFDGGLRHFKINDWQGMISLQLLFSKNTYAGYQSPSYVWQTSAASATQSPKYNIVPLIMGSIKASLLALIVALPLALGAAIYTAYFASASIRNAVKPSIEMLEAIPSVIIGFIAAVWLAPFAEQYLISIFWVIILLPFVVLVIAGIHGYLSTRLPPSKIGNWQLAINASLLLFAVVSIFTLSLLVTEWSQSAPYAVLTDAVSNLTLSKTAIVVSLALGVAIAPTLYTLIDDALFEVPEGVKQASFALGATQVQTLVKVVLVVAFPSIVSAIMLGFGRAFGETMIVLMVTGNTPIANWDLFSGLRTLTSNLAIELQEAQVDSTLYHVLFLTAAVLFLFTFVVNTIAALLKRRLNVYGE